jgi:hypothetical protein
LEKLVEACDIVAVQEHWLHLFEDHRLISDFQHVKSYIRCYDESNPIPPTQRLRGQSGVALIWRDSLDTLVEKIPEGSHRLVMIQLKARPRPIILMCTYMPSSGYSDSKTNFQDMLSELTEALFKYKDMSVIILGDLNASIWRNPPNELDILLRDFIKLHSLKAFHDDKANPTFCSDSSNSTSTIDYFLSRPGDLTLIDYDVLDEDTDPSIFSSNGSDHHPIRIRAVLAEGATLNLQEKSREEPRLGRPKWDREDINLFQDNLRGLLPVNLPTNNTSNLDIELQIHDLTCALGKAVEGAIPRTKILPYKKNRLPPEIVAIYKQSKETYWKWKLEGKRLNDPLHIQLKSQKKLLRSAQRKTESDRRLQLYKEIIDASSWDTRLFYKLINRQRNAKQADTTTCLLVDNTVLKDEEEIVQGWASYFLKLSTPADDPAFDGHYQDHISAEVALLELLVQTPSTQENPHITQKEVEKAIAKLNSGKAADQDGISAEHLKFAGSTIIPTLTNLFNTILIHGYIPQSFKEGTITPILKKGRPKNNPSNYRGITINSIIGKVLEIVCLNRILPILSSQQSSLQRGFTRGVSAMNAALLLLETINDYRDNGQTITATFLDVEKAFDVVWIDALLYKLFHMDIPNHIWVIIASWYRGMSAKVKWNGRLSGTFGVRQGTGQGRTFSPEFFKTFTTKPLVLAEQCGLGAHVGSIHIPCIAFADDIVTLTDSPQGQEVINIISNDGVKHRYKFGIAKTNTIVYNSKSGVKDVPSLSMQGTPLPPTQKATHMGILHSGEPTKTLNSQRIENNIKSARGAVYALFGAGLHGKRGLTPPVTKHLWNTYIIPILTYGAEVWQLTDRDYAPLEIFQRKILRSLQCLPDNTANCATLGLLGVLPVQYTVESKALNLLVAFISNTDSLEHKVALRQIGTKDSSSNSWFTYVQGVLHKCELGTIHQLLAHTPGRTAWKDSVKCATRLRWMKHCQEEVQSKSSLRYISPTTLDADKVSVMWGSARDSPSESYKASIKAKVLTGTYRTQASRAKFNQNSVNTTCLLCTDGPEDREHFLTLCPALHHIRAPWLEKLYSLLDSLAIDSTQIRNDSSMLMQCLMDASHVYLPSSIRSSELVISELEVISRNLIHKLHVHRWGLLKSIQS